MNGQQLVGYHGLHWRLRRYRGDASTHHCVDCQGVATEWSLHSDATELLTDTRHGLKYSLDLGDYSPRCARCHRAYDNRHITHCPAGHEYAGANLGYWKSARQCRKCRAARERARPKDPDLYAAKLARVRERRRLARLAREAT